MRFAIVENNKCVNIARGDTALDPSWIESDTARKGDDYDPGTGQFSRPAIQRALENITIYQLKVALHDAGHLTAADTYVSGLGVKANLLWNQGVYISPRAGMINNLRNALGLTVPQMRDIILAAMEVRD